MEYIIGLILGLAFFGLVVYLGVRLVLAIIRYLDRH